MFIVSCKIRQHVLQVDSLGVLLWIRRLKVTLNHGVELKLEIIFRVEDCLEGFLVHFKILINQLYFR